MLVAQEEEKERYSTHNDIIESCCLRCNNRNLIRAVETENVALLKKLVYDLKRIPSLASPWANEMQEIPLEIAMRKGNSQMIEVLCNIKGLKKEPLKTHDQQVSEFYNQSRV